jgi:porphyrinogen peroxidase
VVQKYLHDLETWAALPIEEQERAIGRTKLDDIELADDVKPANSHVALTTIVDADGEERQIVRFNMPFGRVSAREFGTYFIGYARDPDVIERMLERMFVGEPPGTYDRILDFSTAATGTLFFVPTADFLDDPPAPADAIPDPARQTTRRRGTARSASAASASTPASRAPSRACSRCGSCGDRGTGRASGCARRGSRACCP